MVWVQQLRVRDLRNIREARLELEPGLNVFVGKNGQGKTSLLEAVGLVARGRSFRTDDASERDPSRRGIARGRGRHPRRADVRARGRARARTARVPRERARGAPAGIPRPARRGRVLERAAARGSRDDARPPAVPRPAGRRAVALVPGRAAAVRARADAEKRGARGARARRGRLDRALRGVRRAAAPPPRRLRDAALDGARRRLPAGARALRGARAARRPPGEPEAQRVARAKSCASWRRASARRAAAWPGRTATASSC